MSAVHLAFLFVNNFHTLQIHLIVVVNKICVGELVALVEIGCMFPSPLQEWVTVNN